MLPVNRIINSQRILESGKYQLTSLGNQYNGLENIWLIRYLLDRGLTVRETFEKIKPIYESFNGTLTPNAMKLYTSKAKKCKINKYSAKIVFYKDEIDKIEHFDAPLYEKKIILCILAVFKAEPNTKISQESFYKFGFQRFIKGRNRNIEFSIFQILEKLDESGILLRNSTVFWDQTYGEEYSVDSYSYDYQPDENSEIMFEIDTIADIQSICDQIKSRRICKICGTDFEINERTKRNICIDCWKKNRQNQKNLLKRIKRGQEHDVSII